MNNKYYNYLVEYAIPHIGNVRKACWAVRHSLKHREMDGTKRLVVIDPFWDLQWESCWLDVSPFQMWWRGLTHDISRFYPSEFFAYVNSHGAGKVKRDANGKYSGTAISDDPVELARERAMIWHWYRNRHHWEHWALVMPTTHKMKKCIGIQMQSGMSHEIEYDVPDVKLLNIPDQFILEMACDWWGASMTQNMGGLIWKRYCATKDGMHFTPENRKKFEFCLKLVELTMNKKVVKA